MRFILFSIFRNIGKHGVKSLTSVFLSMLLALFFTAFSGNILAGQAQLEQIGRSMPVSADITDPSGSRNTLLQIPDTLLQAAVSHPAVTDSRYYALLYYEYGLGCPVPDSGVVPDNRLWCLENENTVPAWRDAAGTPAITYLDGYQQMLHSHEAVCMVNAELMKAMGWQLGDPLAITIFEAGYQDISSTCQKVGDAVLTLTASYQPENLEESFPLLILPAGWARDYYQEHSRPFSVSCASFTIGDPFRLNAFKADMKKAGFQNPNPLGEPSSKGEALLVYDDAFIRASSPIKRNVTLLQRLYPLIFLLIALLGFLISFLLLRSRRQEMAIARSLGTGRLRTPLILVGENAVLQLLGVGAAALSIPYLAAGGGRQLFPLLSGYAAVYLLGGIAAVAMLGRMSILEQFTNFD